MKPLVALLLGLTLLESAHGSLESVTILEEGTRLVIRDHDGRTWEPPKRARQVNFASPKISSDRSYAGWLAEVPGCCTSYPVPLQLVVMSKEGQIHPFVGEQAIFDWCFARGSKSVVYRQEALHGPTPALFEMRRISDGKLLRSHEHAWQGPEAQIKPQQLPKWARCAVPASAN